LFSKPRELQINDEQDSSIAEISVFDFQREESHDDPILDLAELLERSIKRTSCQKKFCLYKRKRKTQETEKLQPFLGTFRERKKKKKKKGAYKACKSYCCGK
jgi:hypothetical protein